MPDTSPIDPLAVMQTLISAWNRGLAGGAAPAAIAPSPGADATAHRLAAMEASLMRLEAQMTTLVADSEARRSKRKKAKGD